MGNNIPRGEAAVSPAISHLDPPAPVVRILICGGRGYDDWRLFRKVVEDIITTLVPDTHRVIIISGMASGADTLAVRFAMHNNHNGPMEVWQYAAKWDAQGRNAGRIRNRLMADDGKPHLVIAFPGRWGTADMVNVAKKARIPVIQVGGDEINITAKAALTIINMSGMSNDPIGMLRDNYWRKGVADRGSE